MKSALLAVAAMALIPAAHAQGCDNLRRLVADAPTGFVSFRGESIYSNSFDSKLYLSGAEECSVDVGQETSFYCLWAFENGPAANTQTVALMEAVKLCLPGWSASDIAGSKSPNGLMIEKGSAFAGIAPHAGVSVRVYAEQYAGSQERNVLLYVLPAK